jgi:hypothetical protein
MKKKFLGLTAAILMTLSVTFAQEVKPVPNDIANSFQQEFTTASNVQWKSTNNFYKASFNINDTPLEAFYSFEGALIGVSRHINIDQLPLSLIKDTNEKATASQVTDLFELLTDEGTEYYVTFKNDKETKTYKSSGYSWTRY